MTLSGKTEDKANETREDEKEKGKMQNKFKVP